MTAENAIGLEAIPPSISVVKVFKMRAGFIIETDLGHATYAQNLRAAFENASDIDAEWVEVPFGVNSWQARLPIYSTNWTVRAGLRARAAFQKLKHPDVAFIHTQVLAVLCPDLLLRTPTVISLDATPIQYDAFGELFGHELSGVWLERVKWRLNRSAFDRAQHIVTFSEAARASVIKDYRISQSKVTVVRPGINLKTWSVLDGATDYGPAKILFVGGDFFRKGGPLLVEAFQHLPERGPELHIVTQSDVRVSAPNVFVHRGLGPNSPELIDLFRNCNVFALPTNADFYPQVILEASAMGLAILATDVGAISEIVEQNITGLLVKRGDLSGLTEALRLMNSHYHLRQRLGAQARNLMQSTHEVGATTERLASVLRSAAQAQARPSSE